MELFPLIPPLAGVKDVTSPPLAAADAETASVDRFLAKGEAVLSLVINELDEVVRVTTVGDTAAS